MSGDDPRTGNWSLLGSDTLPAGSAMYLPGVPTYSAATETMEKLPLVLDSIGTGSPPRRALVVPYGHREGGYYQGVVTMPRVWYLRLLLAASTFPALMALHDSWAGKLQPADGSVINLRYHGAASNVDITAVVEGGLDKPGAARGGTLEVPLRLYSYLPFFRSAVQQSATLGPGSYFASFGSHIRKADGSWSGAAGAVDLNVFRYIDGVLWAGGDFTSIGGVSASKIAYFDETAGTWVEPGNGFNDTVFDIVRHPDGSIVAVGDFNYDSTGAGTIYRRIAVWNGTSWANSLNPSSVSGGGIHRAIFGHDGYLYAFGDFTSLSGVANYAAKWDGSSWSNAGSAPSQVTEALIDPSGLMYLYLPGETIDYKSFDGTTITSLLGSGQPPVMGPDGFMYAKVTNTIDRWNGDSWEKVYDDASSNSRIRYIDPFGIMYCDDSTSLINPFRVISQAAVPLDWQMVTPGTQQFLGIAISDDGVREAYAGNGVSGWGALWGAEPTTVTVGGTAKAWPTFEISGPGELVEIANLTTGKRVLFDDLILYDGETVTLDLEAGTFTSDWRGNILRYVLEGSDYDLQLEPGDNVISVFCWHASETVPDGTVYWHDQYLGIGGADA